MQKRNLIILRGISGSGKSTFANLIASPCCICCADDYFTDADGNYNFDASKLGEAHKQCMNLFDQALKDDFITNIVIANTNTKPSDYQYYVDKASKHDINIIYIVLEKRHDNKSIHDVPDNVLQRQYQNLNNNLKLI